MHLNYYFLRRLAEALNDMLVGKTWHEIYSQDKDEIIFKATENVETTIIKATLTSEFTCLSFPENHHRAKKNTIDLFTQVYGLKITSVEPIKNDRSFQIHMENDFSFIFKMHGNRSNIILCSPNEEREVFKHSLKKDHTIKANDLAKSLDQSYEGFVNNGLKNTLPTLGTEMKSHLYEMGFDEKPQDQQWQLIQELLSEIEHPHYYLFASQQKPYLTLFYKEGYTAKYDNTIAASNALFKAFTQTYLFEQKRDQYLKLIETNLQKSKRYVENNYQKLEAAEQRRPYDEVANIIMANLHNISKDQHEVKLEDFYNNSSISIKLKPKQTPQALAEQYYRKAKNQKKEGEIIISNIEQKEQQINVLEEQKKQLESIQDHRQLNTFIKEHFAGLSQKQEDVRKPFYEMQIEGFDILVGKNARSNDEMLRYHSQKNDLWLHARDVAGSHVIIRNRGNAQYPDAVIEKAAQIAAFYSKRKHDSLSPVIYTYRKYVRKAKNLPPGQVLVEKENVVIVKPEKPIS